MSCCGKTHDQQLQVHQNIEKHIRAEAKDYQKEVKLLLLGAGDSGKSTIAKQMKIIHLNGFSEQELLHYRPVVIANTIQSIKALIFAAEKFGLAMDSALSQTAERVARLNAISLEFNEDVATAIKSVWEDPAIQAAYVRQAEFQLPGVAEYCFKNIDRFASPTFVPTTEDALRCRARTTGIIETVFADTGTVYRMVDMGGQRSERRKWIKCFHDVNVVLFVAAMNEYDMRLFEDDAVNRMHESLALFEEICNSVWFQRTTLFLFLNKKDLFHEKLPRVPLTVCFPEAPATLPYEPGCEFVKGKFLERNQIQDRDTYVHFTCATDTNAMELIFRAVRDSQMRIQMELMQE